MEFDVIEIILCIAMGISIIGCAVCGYMFSLERSGLLDESKKKRR